MNHLLCSSMIMNSELPSAQRVLAYLFIPFGLLLLIPILMLFVFGFYVLALVHLLRSFLLFLQGRNDLNDAAVQKPHFLEAQFPEKTVSNGESNQSS